MQTDAQWTTEGAIRRYLSSRSWLWVTICYLSLAVIFFWPAIWEAAVPLPLMNPYTQGDPVWSAAARSATAAGSNRLLGDVSGFYYPYLVFSIERLRAGEFPLWNPHIFGGVPYFAANQAALLFPINLIGYLCGPYWFWTVTALLRLVLAGGGMYMLARRLSIGRGGALLAGGVYMFGAFNITWIHFAVHNVAALLPLALWLILRIGQRADRQARNLLRLNRDALALAGVVAAQMFGGHPEMSLFFMLICALFAVAQLLPVAQATSDGWAGRLAPVALALLLGLGLSAVQWIPTLDLIRKSYTLEDRGFAIGQEGAAFAPLGALREASWGNLRHWLLLVAPELWGSPRGDQINYWLPGTNYNEMASYVGLATLPLALLGALGGRNRWAARFFAGLLLLSLLLLYPLPGLRLIGFLPLFNIAYGFRFGLGVTLAAALLAGMGLDRLPGLRPRRLLVVSAGLLALALLNLAIGYDLWGGTRVAWALGWTPDAPTRAMIAGVYQPQNLRPLLPGLLGLLTAGLLAAAALGRLASARAATLMSGLALAELLAHGYGYNGFTPPAAVYPSTRAIAYLASGGPANEGRALNLDGALWANSAMTHGLYVTGGLDDLMPGTQGRFLKRGMSGVVSAGDRQVMLDWGQRLADLMNARYVLSRRAVTLSPQGHTLPLALTDGELRVYRNDTALPRAYAATSIVPATRHTAEDLVFDDRFDPHQAVVLEVPVPPGIGGPPRPVQPVTLLCYSANRVELAPDLPSPAVLVLADSYDPDWHVTIDGHPARLLRANGMFRGVAVPAGRHHVVFSYRPRAVLWSGLISMAALATALVGSVPGLMRRSRV